MACLATKYTSADLRTLVRIERAIRQSDGAGGFREADWVLVFDAWAAVKQLSDFKRFQHQQMEQEVTHLVAIRYVSGLDTTMRIVLPDGRRFEIVGLNDLEERHVWLELKAKAPLRMD